MGSIVGTPEIHPELAIAEGGTALGNVDPRFGDRFDVSASRLLAHMRMPFVEQTYVIRPKGRTDFIDVDIDSDPRIQESKLFNETEVVGDALITNRRGVGLMMNPGDCIPMVVAEPEKDILALIHLGWRGAVHKLHKYVFDYSQQIHGFDPGNAVAYIGPSIASESYTTNVLHPFQKIDDLWQNSIRQNSEGFHIDIPGFVMGTLVDYGFKEENISCSSADTGAPDSKHFSFTRHKKVGVPDGRNAFLVALHPR